MLTRWALGDEIDRLGLGSNVLAGAVDPDVSSHDLVFWLRKPHIPIQDGFVCRRSSQIVTSSHFAVCEISKTGKEKEQDDRAQSWATLKVKTKGL